MTERWKQHIMKINGRRAFITFLVTALIAAGGFSAALYANFHTREQQWESRQESAQITEYSADGSNKEMEDGDEAITNDHDSEDELYSRGLEGRDTENGQKGVHYDEAGREEEDFEDTFTTGDKVLIGAAAAAGVILLIWYWILCMIWAYRKAVRLGVSGAPWVLVTFFLNLVAIFILYMYGWIRGTCHRCGKIRVRGSSYCDRCGAKFVQDCPNCGHTVSAESAYCPNCGSKLLEGRTEAEKNSSSDGKDADNAGQ